MGMTRPMVPFAALPQFCFFMLQSISFLAYKMERKLLPALSMLQETGRFK
jgi:hypothetical protein